MCIIFSFILQPLSLFAQGSLPLPITTDPVPPVPTAESAWRTKEYSLTIFGVTTPGISLDKLAIIVFKKILENMSDAMVEYINNGFKNPDGSMGPAFATDPEGFFIGVADEIGGRFIESIGAGALCSPFKFQIEASLNASYRGSRATSPSQVECTISGTAANVENFFNGDFAAGGWDTWFDVSQNPQNNPVGALIETQSELNLRLSTARDNASTKLDWANGFLSFEECEEVGSEGRKCDIRTPGSVVEANINKMLGSEISQLELADEFDDIIGALIGQLQGKVFSSTAGLITQGQNTDWAGSGANGRPDQSQGYCFATPNSVFLQRQTPVRWTVNYSGGTNPTYSWSGDENLSGSTAVITKTYQTAGIKKATVIINDSRTVNGVSTVLPPKTIICDPSVTVEEFEPLAISCTVDKRWAAPGEPITWSIKVTGGSRTSEYEIRHSIFNYDRGKKESDTDPKPFIPVPQSGEFTFTGRWEFWPGGDTNGKKRVLVRVRDGSRSVAEKTEECPTIDIRGPQ